MSYVTPSLPKSEHAEIHKIMDSCDWLGCYLRARWEVGPKPHLLLADVPAGLFCTSHARRAIKHIERAGSEKD